MRKNTLPRLGSGWAHPYGHGPFSPVLYADGGGGDGGGSGSGSNAGGDGGGGDGGAGGQGAGQQGGQSGGQNGGNQGSGQGGSGDNGQDIKSLPDWAQQLISNARADAGKARTTAKENAANEARQQLAQEIGKALGLVQDDKQKADPAQLTRTIGDQTKTIGDLQGSVRSLTVELAAYKTAGKHGADPAALLDSRSFLQSVEGLDPTAADFATKLDRAIKDAVENNQQLRAGQAPRRGGGDFAGGPGAQQRSTSLHDAIAARMGG